MLGRVLRRAEVWVHSDGLSDADVRSALMTPVDDVTTAVADALGRAGAGARLCVLPHGPADGGHAFRSGDCLTREGGPPSVGRV